MKTGRSWLTGSLVKQFSEDCTKLHLRKSMPRWRGYRKEDKGNTLGSWGIIIRGRPKRRSRMKIRRAQVRPAVRKNIMRKIGRLLEKKSRGRQKKSKASLKKRMVKRRIQILKSHLRGQMGQNCLNQFQTQPKLKNWRESSKTLY